MSAMNKSIDQCDKRKNVSFTIKDSIIKMVRAKEKDKLKNILESIR